MEKGTVLLTKDGRRIGNAIVLEKGVVFNTIVYLIKTDFGNVVRFTEDDIEKYFHMPTRKSKIEEWMANKLLLFWKIR